MVSRGGGIKPFCLLYCKKNMIGVKKYYKIPFTKTKFFIQWRDGKFQRVGFYKPMSFIEAITRLENKRIRRSKLIFK